MGKGHGIRNPFLGRGEEEGQHHLQQQQQKKKKNREEEAKTKTGKDDTEENDDDDPTKQIYKYLKGLLKEWEQDLTERPDIVARSVAGRNESKTLKQCKDYIRPLFKLCKTRKLEPGLEAHLIKIVSVLHHVFLFKSNLYFQTLTFYFQLLFSSFIFTGQFCERRRIRQGS